MVSLLSGENDIAQPTGFLCEQIENNSKVSPTLACPDIRHIAAPHLIRFCYYELSLKAIWNNDVFMTTTFIPVGRLLTTHQSKFFHEPSGKPASHSETSQGCHNRDTSCTSRAMADVMQLQNLTA